MAGRAGRGEIPGRVIVQTYTPYHPAVQTALKQDFEKFYRDEIQARRELGLPPFAHMAMIQLRGENEQEVAKAAARMADELPPYVPDDTIISPAVPSPMAKKRGQYYYQIMMRTQHIVALSRALKQMLARQRRSKTVLVSVDIDPHAVV